MDATIKEGNVGRSFSPVDKLKINLQNDGGESLWVPDDSVQLDELYTSTNGTYYAAPRDIYGWGVVTVDVDNSIDEPDDLYDDDEDQEEEPEGNWYFIDPDTDDRVDIEEDENGWYFIDPDTGDRVDIEEDDDGWYFIDPDTGERVDIEEDEDGDPYFIDPETGERVDIDWDGDGEKPDNPWSPNSGGGGDEPGGGGDDEDQDDDSWDDWDDEPDEDWNEDEEEEEDEEDDDWGDDDEDWEEEGDDEDDSITDGDEYDYLDDDGNLVEEECPASIKVMHVPNKTEYTDGWAIDYDGLVVQAFDKDGNPWTSPEYPDGYIPAHKLNLEKYSDYNSGIKTVTFPENQSTGDAVVNSVCDLINSNNNQVIDGVFSEANNPESDYYNPEAVSSFETIKNMSINHPTVYEQVWNGSNLFQGWTPFRIHVFDSISINDRINLEASYTCKTYMVYFFSNTGEIRNTAIVESRRTIYIGKNGNDFSTLNAEENNEDRTQSIPVEFPTPCGDILTATFDISVKERQNHGGSHHSGKF